MNESDLIFVAGHRGLVGSALMRALSARGFRNVLVRSSSELDLRNQAAVDAFFAEQHPAYVLLAAARVGGIQANSRYPADFIRDNLQVQTNVIDAAWRGKVRKLLFLGSSCIYPKYAPQPMPESSLLTGSLEPTNEWYAIAKIAGLKMCQAYHRQHGFDAIAAMPTNLYGPGDNFDLDNSHVLPALLRKFHEARQTRAPYVVVWGTGSPRREFLHVDDLAAACLFLMERYSGEEPVNIGWGADVSIAELAQLIREIVGYKLLDVGRLSELGWSAQVRLREGIQSTYRWFVEHSGELEDTRLTRQHV
jgi:GDP-L-fucose synthase